MADLAFGKRDLDGDTHHDVCSRGVLLTQIGCVTHLRLEEVEMEGKMQPKYSVMDGSANGACISFDREASPGFAYYAALEK